MARRSRRNRKRRYIVRRKSFAASGLKAIKRQSKFMRGGIRLG